MAQKVSIQLVDDIDGTEAVETIAFGLDGMSYEIDLNKTNATKLRKALTPFAGKARTIRPSRGAGVKVKRTGPNPADVREWAKAQGIEVGPKGRVPQSIMDQYSAAN